LGREQEEEEKRKHLEKASGKSQNDEVEAMDFEQSQSGVGVGQECQRGKKKNFDEEMLDVDAALKREKEEMKNEKPSGQFLDLIVMSY
jgi:hypothetical protein